MNFHLLKKRTPAEKTHYKLRKAKDVCENRLFLLEIKYRELVDVLKDESNELFNNCHELNNDVFLEFRYDIEKLLDDILGHTRKIIAKQFSDECLFIKLRYDQEASGCFDDIIIRRQTDTHQLLTLWHASLKHNASRMFDEIIGEGAGLTPFSEEDDALRYCKRCGHKMPQHQLFLFEGKMMCAFCETNDNAQLHLYKKELENNAIPMIKGKQWYEDYLLEKKLATFLYDLARSLQLKKKTAAGKDKGSNMIEELKEKSIAKRRLADKLYAKYLKSFFHELYAIIPDLEAQDDSYYYLFLRAHVYKEFFVPHIAIK